MHRTPASRVVFGAGVIGTLAAELALLGIRRPLVISGRRTAASDLHARVRDALAGVDALWFDGVPAHSSVATVAGLVAMAREGGVDGFVAVGGGSASDSAKATALWLAEGGALADHATRFTAPDRLHVPLLTQPKLPIVAVPGTASAAEVTPSLGIRDEGGHGKLLFTDPLLAARLIVIDPEANLGVPAALMLATGFNGLAHCLEGLYSTVRTPVTTALALHGTRLFFDALPRVATAPADVDARAALLTAAHLSGQVLLNARTALHHAICHAIGAATGAGHGDANAVMLPNALAFNLPAAATELGAAAQAVGLGDDPGALVDAVRALRGRIGVPAALRELGLQRAQLPAIAAQVMHERGLFFNPRRVQAAEEIEALLELSW